MCAPQIEHLGFWVVVKRPKMFHYIRWFQCFLKENVHFCIENMNQNEFCSVKDMAIPENFWSSLVSNDFSRAAYDESKGSIFVLYGFWKSSIRTSGWSKRVPKGTQRVPFGQILESACQETIYQTSSKKMLKINVPQQISDGLSKKSHIKTWSDTNVSRKTQILSSKKFCACCKLL